MSEPELTRREWTAFAVGMQLGLFIGAIITVLVARSLN